MVKGQKEAALGFTVKERKGLIWGNLLNYASEERRCFDL